MDIGKAIQYIKNGISSFYDIVKSLFSFLPEPFSTILLTALIIVLVIILARALGVVK